MCIGHTLGEEILFQKQKYRTETVSAVTECCVLQVDIVNFRLMGVEKHVGAGGSSLVDDYNQLMQVLQTHCSIKNGWRQSEGLIK